MQTSFPGDETLFPIGRRLLAGLVGGLVIYALAQVAAGLVPEDGSVFLKLWISGAGALTALLAPVFAAFDVGTPR